MLDTLARRTGGDVQGLRQAIGTARIETVAFALYAQQPLALDSLLQDGLIPLLERHGVALLGVARAGLPSLVVRLGMGVVARQGGLEPMQVEGRTVYRLSQEGVHLRLYAQGNLLYLALAPTPALADATIASAFPRD
ncbi:hypothetical protein HRbin23_01678 [bacterium HR23]|nr:hypothetical protein HRbin23_01678 [bacterium HR23]